MELTFSSEIVEQYQSGSQKARVLTENWVSHNMFCPRCGYEHITQFEANRPVADFYWSFSVNKPPVQLGVGKKYFSIRNKPPVLI